MGRLRGCLWLTAGLVVALLAGFVGYMTLTKYGAQANGAPAAAAPQVQVVVAARAVSVRSPLTADDVEVKNVPVDAAPEGSLREVAAAAGKLTLVDLFPGEILLSQRLSDPNVISGDGRQALVMAENEVLTAFPASDLLSKVGVLKPGDHVDMLFTVKFPAGAQGDKEEPSSLTVLDNVTISALVGGSAPAEGQQPTAPSALLLVVNPQDALVLKYLRDNGAVMDQVLRAPGAEQPFTVEPVDMNYLVNRYRVQAQVGR